MPADLHPVPTPRSRAVLYLRQSTYREDSISLELQETAGRDYCRRQGYEVVQVEADEGISGRRWSNRPAVQRVIKMIDDQQADVIVVWKWSRLSRNRLDWAVAIDEVEQHGGRVESATEPVDTTTSTGRLARGMLAEFAAFESERIGDTWKETIRRRISQGLPHNGRPRFGYRKTRDGRFEPDPETAPILQEVYRRYLNGEGFVRLIKWLNSRGILNTMGHTWSVNGLISTLSSPFAAGYVTHQGKTFPGVHEPIIDDLTWQAFKAKRAKAGLQGPRDRVTRHMLKGVLVCEACGKHLQLIHHNGRPRNGYRCPTGVLNREHPSMIISRQRAESAVLGWLWAYVDEVEQAAQTGTPVRRLNTSGRLRRRIETLEAQAENLTLGWAAKTVPDAFYRRAARDLDGQIREAKSQLSEAVIGEQGQDRRRQIVAHVREVWVDATPDEQNQLLRALLDRAVVGKPEHGWPRIVRFEAR